MKVVILDSAKTDIRELKSYVINNFGAAAWLTTYGTIKQAFGMAQQHPKAGKTLPELDTLNIATYRQVLAGLNRVIYELRADAAYVHVVCDSRRALQGLLTRRLVRPG